MAFYSPNVGKITQQYWSDKKTPTEKNRFAFLLFFFHSNDSPRFTCKPDAYFRIFIIDGISTALNLKIFGFSLSIPTLIDNYLDQKLIKNGIKMSLPRNLISSPCYAHKCQIKLFDVNEDLLEFCVMFHSFYLIQLIVGLRAHRPQYTIITHLFGVYVYKSTIDRVHVVVCNAHVYVISQRIKRV